MPDDRWRPYVAFGLLGAILAFVAALIIWDEAVRLTEERFGNQDRAKAHIEYAQDRIEQNCLALEGVALRDCIQKEIEAAQDHGRAEGDLQAQQTMARFTRLMGYTGVAGIALGGLSVLLILATLWETRAGVEAMRSEQRPWLSIDVDLEAALFRVALRHYSLRFTTTIRNHGKTVATRAKCFASVEIGELDGPTHTLQPTQNATKDLVFPDGAIEGPGSASTIMVDSLPPYPHSIKLTVWVEYHAPGAAVDASAFSTKIVRDLSTTSGGQFLHSEDFASAQDAGDAVRIDVYIREDGYHPTEVV